MTPKERAKQLAEDHWNGYIKPLMEVHGENPENIAVIGFHYVTSGIHFYGHAIEDERNGMFDELEIDIAAISYPEDCIAATSLCPNCLDTDKCGGVMINAKGECLHYRPSLRERILDAKQAQPSLCHSCHIPKCDKPLIERCEMEGVCAQYVPEAKQEAPLPDMGCATTDCCNHSTTYLRNCAAYLPWAMRQCEKYTTAKQEAPTAAVLPLDFTLPSIALKCTAEEAVEKFLSEMDEWGAAKEGSLHELVEKWDCLQALYTAYQRGADVDWYQDNVRTVMAYLTEYAAEGRDVMKARRGMLLKNAKRPNPEGGTGYYSPEVCAAIIASGGNSWK